MDSTIENINNNSDSQNSSFVPQFLIGSVRKCPYHFNSTIILICVDPSRTDSIFKCEFCYEEQKLNYDKTIQLWKIEDSKEDNLAQYDWPLLEGNELLERVRQLNQNKEQEASALKDTIDEELSKLKEQIDLKIREVKWQLFDEVDEIIAKKSQVFDAYDKLSGRLILRKGVFDDLHADPLELSKTTRQEINKLLADKEILKSHLERKLEELSSVESKVQFNGFQQCYEEIGRNLSKLSIFTRDNDGDSNLGVTNVNNAAISSFSSMNQLQQEIITKLCDKINQLLQNNPQDYLFKDSVEPSQLSQPLSKCVIDLIKNSNYVPNEIQTKIKRLLVEYPIFEMIDDSFLKEGMILQNVTFKKTNFGNSHLLEIVKEQQGKLESKILQGQCNKGTVILDTVLSNQLIYQITLEFNIPFSKDDCVCIGLIEDQFIDKQFVGENSIENVFQSSCNLKESPQNEIQSNKEEQLHSIPVNKGINQLIIRFCVESQEISYESFSFEERIKYDKVRLMNSSECKYRFGISFLSNGNLCCSIKDMRIFSSSVTKV